MATGTTNHIGRKKVLYPQNLDTSLRLDAQTLDGIAKELGLTDKWDIDMLSCLYANISKVAGEHDTVYFPIPPGAPQQVVKIVRLLILHNHLAICE